MNHRRIARIALPAVGLLWLSAAPSLAATPIDGSPYVSDPYESVTGEQAAAKLVVSRDGERLVARRGAFVSAHSPCRQARGGGDGGANVVLTSPVPIRRDGSFHLVERRGDTILRLRGRFTRRWSARLVVGIRDRAGCRVGPTVLKLRHVGDVPFRDCRDHAAETIARSRQGRIFLHRRGPGVFGVERAYGCLHAAGRRFPLGIPDKDGSGGPRLFRLAGPYAGFVQVSCAAACGHSVNVKDLRDGATVRRLCCQLGVTDLVLSPKAAYAFIEDPEDGPPEVRAASGTSPTLLESGADINRTSLRLEGNTLSWVKDGSLRTAPLE